MKNLNVKMLFAALLCSSFMGLQGAATKKLNDDLQAYRKSTTDAQRKAALEGIANSPVVHLDTTKRYSRDIPAFAALQIAREGSGVTIQKIARDLLAAMATPAPTPSTPSTSSTSTTPPVVIASLVPAVTAIPVTGPAPSSSTTTSSSSAVSATSAWADLAAAINVFKSNANKAHYERLAKTAATAKLLTVSGRAEAANLLAALTGINVFSSSTSNAQNKRSEARAAMIQIANKVTSVSDPVSDKELADNLKVAYSGGIPPLISTTPVAPSTSTPSTAPATTSTPSTTSTTAPAKTAPSTPVTTSPAKTAPTPTPTPVPTPTSTPSPATPTPTPSTSTPSVTPPAKTAAATGPLGTAEFTRLEELNSEAESTGTLSATKRQEMESLLTRAEKMVAANTIGDTGLLAKIANTRSTLDLL